MVTMTTTSTRTNRKPMMIPAIQPPPQPPPWGAVVGWVGAWVEVVVVAMVVGGGVVAVYVQETIWHHCEELFRSEIDRRAQCTLNPISCKDWSCYTVKNGVWFWRKCVTIVATIRKKRKKKHTFATIATHSASKPHILIYSVVYSCSHTHLNQWHRMLNQCLKR